MRKALVVGLDAYQGNELHFCGNDATAMEELLKTNGDGSPDFEVEKIADECTSKLLTSRIVELFSGDADVALLYFSGHGCQEGGGMLCTTDSDSGTVSGVNMDFVLDKANKSKCKNKVIILDCCFAAKMGEMLLSENESVLGDGVTIIAASRSWEYSKETSELEHGVFTNLLLLGLEGGAADVLGRITPASLYAFVDQSLGAWDQRPVFKSNISQFLPIRKVEAKVPFTELRRLKEYFRNASDEFKLDPSYEYTNTLGVKHEIVEPYADPVHVAIFKDLQLYQSVGLVEPVGEDFMYFAAMNSKSCKLTALGAHYWRMAKDNRI